LLSASAERLLGAAPHGRLRSDPPAVIAKRQASTKHIGVRSTHLEKLFKLKNLKREFERMPGDADVRRSLARR
jgi:hypothetical protein